MENQNDRHKQEEWTVEKLVNLRDENIIHVNSEYQRGAVWNDDQKRMLIDSVLRGYRIPLFYFRLIKRGDEMYGSRTLEVVDGQQRINALYDFVEEKIPPLFDPFQEKWFPESFGVEECPWAGKVYPTLPDDINLAFNRRTFSVVVMDCDEDEARDLFIRLQHGSALNAQEVRDAWPGKFCELVLELGGKEGLGLPGHDFVRNLVRSPSKDRGKKRQAAAHLLMQFMERCKRGEEGFVAGKSEVLDEFYRRHVNLQTDSPEIRRFRSILDKLAELFAGHHPLKIHEAVDIMLFVNDLWDKRSRDWERGIVAAFHDFTKATALAWGITLDGSESEDFQQIWSYNLIASGRGSNNVGKIRERYAIFASQMTRLLAEHLRG